MVSSPYMYLTHLLICRNSKKSLMDGYSNQSINQWMIIVISKKINKMDDKIYNINK